MTDQSSDYRYVKNRSAGASQKKKPQGGLSNYDSGDYSGDPLDNSGRGGLTNYDSGDYSSAPLGRPNIAPSGYDKGGPVTSTSANRRQSNPMGALGTMPYYRKTVPPGPSEPPPIPIPRDGDQSFDLGGSVEDTQSGDNNTQSGDNTASNGNDALKAVDDALSYGRQQITGQGQQMASNTPARPAGPGGDQPDTNPFPTKTPAIPFGNRDPNKPLPIQNFGPGQTMSPSSYASGGAITPVSGIDLAHASQSSQVDDANGNPDQPAGPAADANGTPDQPVTGGQGAVPAQSTQGDQGAIPTQQPDGGGGNAPHQLLQKGASAIRQYLSGAGALSAQTVEQFKQTADPDNSLPPGNRNLAAVKAAMEKGGPKAAFGVMQYYRKTWDHEQNLARASLNGANGRPPNPDDVVAHANAAYPHMPDGTNITFSKSENGYRAAIEFSGGAKYQNVDLTPEQMNEWVNIGKSGQFDGVYENGGAAVLQKIAQGQGTPLQTSQASAGSTNRTAIQQKSSPAALTAMSGFDPQDIAIAKARFQSVNDYPKMLDFLQELRAKRQEEATTVKAAEAKQGNAIEVANIRGNISRANSGDKTIRQQMHEQNQLDIAMQNIKQRGASQQDAQDMKLIENYNSQAAFGVQKPQQILDAENRIMSAHNQSAQQGQQPQAEPQDQGTAPAPRQAAPGPAPAPAARKPAPTGANAAGNPNLGQTRIVTDPKTGQRYRVQ